MIDAFPSLFTSLKMILTISRHYSSVPRMTYLFLKITYQLMRRSAEIILDGQGVNELWHTAPDLIIKRINGAKNLFKAYRQHYKRTSEKLAEMPNRKQMDFDPEHIFGEASLYCRRLDKLIDIFSSVHQFSLLSSQYINNLQGIIKDFNGELKTFQNKKHDLLNHKYAAFERDYIEFVQRRSVLENEIQKFIDRTFSSMHSTNINASLDLLNKLKLILKRETLQDQLNEKYMSLFRIYGKQLEEIRKKYENFKTEPPVGRNMTLVAGVIQWARQLFRRIAEPMDKFKENQKVFVPKESHKIIKLYNSICHTLAEFEVQYFDAWCKECDKSKAVLQRKLIVRSEQTGEIYANFDRRIFELFRETKFLIKMGKDVPESARVILLLEDRLKLTFGKIHGVCGNYNRIMRSLSPVLKTILKPHFEYVKKVMWPGLVSLTWTSMTIDEYVLTVNKSVTELANLIQHTNDINENRIKTNLGSISNTTLIDMPEDVQFELQKFMEHQNATIKTKTDILKRKSKEIEAAVNDLILDVQAFPGVVKTVVVSDEEYGKVRSFYQSLLYHSILSCIKSSLNGFRKRVTLTKTGKKFNSLFNVKLILKKPDVRISPSLDDTQSAIDDIAKNLIFAAKELNDWGVGDNGEKVEIANFFTKLREDKKIKVVILLLTGTVKKIKTQISDYLTKYSEFSWLWLTEPDDAYANFLESTENPILEDFIEELQKVNHI
eukprot:UN24451